MLKRFAREKKEYTARALEEVHRIQKSTTTHVDDQTQQLVDFRLESERFGFFFSRHDDDDDESVCVRVLSLCVMERKNLSKRSTGEKTRI
jgi:hypothetical protein